MARSKGPRPLPPSVFHILLALGDEEQHGYAIMRKIGEITDGAVHMGPGTLYGSIKRMLADGLIEEADVRPDPALDDERRRYYRVTGAGAQARADETRRMQVLVRNATPRLGNVEMRSVRVYRALTGLYPPRFRREYGESMVQLFQDRLRHDGSRRAWSNALRDLTISAPNEHWESYMHATTHTKLVAAAIVTSVAAIVFLLVGGAILGLGLLVLLAWELYAILRTRGHRLSGQAWWKFAASGIALFAVLFVIFAMPWPQDWRSSVDGELAWFVAMLGFSTSVVLVVTGAFMGFAHWITRRSHHTAV